MLSLYDVKSGEYVKVIPGGMLCSVNYTRNGVLSGITIYDESNERKMDQSLVHVLQKANIVPSRLSIKKSEDVTIFGVLSSESVLLDTGIYPYSIYDKIISRISSCSILSELGLSFLAIDIVKSDLNSFVVYQGNTQMEIMGFKVLPGFSISMDMDNSMFNNLKCNYGYPLISGYYIFNGNSQPKFVTSNITCHRVKSVKRFVNSVGAVMAHIDFEDGESDIESYSTIVSYNVQKDCYVLIDEDKIVYSSSKSNTNFKRVENVVECEFCKSKIPVSKSGLTFCPDINCTSRQYPIFNRFISKMNLPSMSFDQYVSLVHQGKLYSILDLFTLEDYKDVEIECTLSEFLDSIFPASVRRSADYFQKFAQSVGSVETARHYIENYENISHDLNLEFVESLNVMEWLSDPGVNLIVSSMFDIETIHITQSKPVLEDMPKFFKNRNIYLMGRFKNGDFENIVSILSSYGAEIVDKIDNRCDWVLLGSLGPVDEEYVNLAMAYKIPIYDELEFFKAYQIDSDIKNVSKSM